jgi:hypothetical protein
VNGPEVNNSVLFLHCVVGTGRRVVAFRLLASLSVKPEVIDGRVQRFLSYLGLMMTTG